MKKYLSVAFTFLFFFGLSFSAQADLLFEDDFNSNIGALNSVPIGWKVTSGTVDIIPVGNSWNYFPANGLYVDLDGSTSDAGVLSIDKVFHFLANEQYVLSFDLAGSQRGSTERVIVDVVVGQNTYSLISSTAFTHIVLPFADSNPFSGTISFSNAGGDNIGALLDNVRLERVPEPATLLLLGAGLIGLAGIARKKLI